MDKHIEITSLYDPFTFGALRLSPSGERRGGLVLLHEIFGLDAPLIKDAKRWAEIGFEVLAPSLFDRCVRGFSVEHDDEGVKQGFECLKKTPDDQALGDIGACVEFLASSGPVFVLGYCYGGRLAWSAATRLPGVAAAVTYYGNILAQVDAQPRCPTMLHFGEKDPHLPVVEIALAMRKHHPDIPIHLYPGSGHGFNNEGASDANPVDAAEAMYRTRVFFERNRRQIDSPTHMRGAHQIV